MVPDELRAIEQWLVWRFERLPTDKKPRKVPYYVAGSRRLGTQGSPEDRIKLTSFDAAFNEKTRGKYDGIGFAFLPGDGLIGIDLDNVIDLDTGEMSERARNIISACDSYTEYSPSRKGVHIFVKGAVEKSFKSNAIGVEVFCGAQFFTFTGQHFAGTPQSVKPIADNVLKRLQATVAEARGQRGASRANLHVASENGVATRTKVESALAVIAADLPYDEWIEIGMSIHAELGEVGFGVWDYWSSKGSKYPGSKQLESHWRSFKAGSITGATLYKMARDAGWRPPGLPKPAGGPKVEGPDHGGRKNKKKQRRGFNWQQFFDRFTLIYPTETAWDADLRKLVKISAMKLMFGKGVVDFWLESTDPNTGMVRRSVNETDVVFDPSCSCDPDTTVNLFSGMKMQPSNKGSTDRILDLLHYLCGEDGPDTDGNAPVTDWVLNWMAYPLQHPGAKMQTAIVMYGPEGTGKNLFWGALSEIYGEYGGFITQFQLQSQFNDWASRRLFVVANEVLTRMEVRHMVGYLKNLVTEKRIPIETKNMPVRVEDNRMQLVFLSNELQPLIISPLDRRYMCIRTPASRSREYYAAIDDELKAGGFEALYDFLLKRNLKDFNEHTKPIETQAKRDLTELGLSTPQAFWQEIHDGVLEFPYVPALADDVYGAYRLWCGRIGEKNPSKQPQFSHQFSSMNGILRSTKRVADPGKPAELAIAPSKRRQRRVFFMGDQPEGDDESAWLHKGVETFRAALRAYAEDAGPLAASKKGNGGDDIPF